MIQLDPTIPVVTPDGKGEAIGWIDYSKDDDLLWIVFLQSNGECWIYPNHLVRACPNITVGRMPGMNTTTLIEEINHPHKPVAARSVKNKKNGNITPFHKLLEKSHRSKVKQTNGKMN